MMQLYLIVGLGNPGAQYAHTRHNAGFDVVDILSQKTGIRLTRRRGRAIVGEGVRGGKKLILAQPQTFMNLSGESVSALVRWYKPPLSQVICVYDDVDLPAGGLRVRPSGSSGTHNGMRSITATLGSEDFPRVRVGVGRPPQGFELADWVLSHYESEAARRTAFDSYMTAADAVLALVDGGVEAAMRGFNRRPAREDA